MGRDEGIIALDLSSEGIPGDNVSHLLNIIIGSIMRINSII